MELTNEQEDRIVATVIERILNSMPEVIGNLMAEHANNNKLKEEFFSKHEEFKKHLDVVTSVVEAEEGKKLGQDYETILNNSVEKIEEQIKIKNSLDLGEVKKKDALDLNINIDDSFGEL